jgi:2-phosphosulfolactate phosphatase
LSPASFLDVEPEARVVLPSPNGATLSLEAGHETVFAGCLRNATAVAQEAQAAGKRILVVPCGERWPDGSLRPCLEDWLGAGAIIDALPCARSPEAEAARAAFCSMRDALARHLEDCTSGQELIERGFGEDVRLAAQWNVSQAVPVLCEGAYRLSR